MSQLHVIAEFCLENKGKYILEVLGHADPKDVKRRERERKHEREGGREREREGPLALWLLFLCFFFLPCPRACPMKLG